MCTKQPLNLLIEFLDGQELAKYYEIINGIYFLKKNDFKFDFEKQPCMGIYIFIIVLTKILASSFKVENETIILINKDFNTIKQALDKKVKYDFQEYVLIILESTDWQLILINTLLKRLKKDYLVKSNSLEEAWARDLFNKDDYPKIEVVRKHFWPKN